MSTTINKNLGHVTAYAYAKAGGYTGTEAQFQTLLGNIAIDLAEIENLTVVVNTLPAGSSATSSYSDGVLTLGIPRGDTGEVSDADLAEALEDYVEKTTLDDYAQVDGYYQEMTVGDAEQLVATTFTEDDAPYNFRTAGGAIDIGDRKQVEGIVGGTIAWNQLQKNTGSRASGGITYTYENGKVTANGTANANSWWLTVNSGSTWNFYKDHIYCICLGNKDYVLDTSHDYWYIPEGFSPGQISANEVIRKCTVDALSYLQYMIREGITIDNKQFTPQVFDLTQMFGSTIADYLYSLEQANAGAGVAWFKKLFPKPYYAYNAGELMSVKALRHITRGFNAWDEEWEVGSYSSTGQKVATQGGRIRSTNMVRVLPNTTYYMSGGVYILCQYDEDENFIGFTQLGSDASSNTGHTVTTSENTHFVAFATYQQYGTTYNHDICINLSWDGERDGEYEEYSEHVYELDPDLELRGIPKLSAGNDLYYDGDVYEADGTVTRKYGVVTLTNVSANEIAISNSEEGRFRLSTGRFPGVKFLGNAISPIYLGITANIAPSSAPDKTIYFNNSSSNILVYMRNMDLANKTISEIAAALEGQVFVYELATPTEESADPYNGTQIVDDFGTEEFVDAGVAASTPTRDVAIPVGHNSLYQPNLRAKLEMVPEAPEDNGYYVVYHHDGINEYVPLIIPQELPELPSEDGTYTLKATVSGGTPTYTWEAEE